MRCAYESAPSSTGTQTVQHARDVHSPETSTLMCTEGPHCSIGLLTPGPVERFRQSVMILLTGLILKSLAMCLGVSAARSQGRDSDNPQVYSSRAGFYSKRPVRSHNGAASIYQQKWTRSSPTLGLSRITFLQRTKPRVLSNSAES
jgi:hypothetical protein